MTDYIANGYEYAPALIGPNNGYGVFMDVAGTFKIVNLPFTSGAVEVVSYGATGTATGSVGAETVVRSIRHDLTIAEVNTGAHTILPAVAGLKYRIIDASAVAYGGNINTVTTVDIVGTQTTAVKLVAFAQASLTRSSVLKMGGTGAAVLADGASYTPCDADTAITIENTGGDITTGTGIIFTVTYALEA